jgi:hypothetical protein
MKARSWSFVDKSAWPPGPWHDEPDKLQWTDTETGLPCLIVRNERMGNLCGYVGVSKGHPAFEQDYRHLPIDISVHGGLTFADRCSGDEHGVCHVVEAGEDDAVWWLGFDCGHWDDVFPAYVMPRMVADRSSYKTVAYVQAECHELAVQLAGPGEVCA